MFTPVDQFDGPLRMIPEIHPDDRGTFHEWFKATNFEHHTGYPLDLQQANLSTSRAGVLRGLHFSDVPPAQAKLVTCVAGAIFDVIVDVRIGSPTFGKWASFELTEDNREALYVPNGFAHGFLALKDSTVVYLTSSEYDPEAEHAISALDDSLDIAWPHVDYVRSKKDEEAPKLESARDKGMLPGADEAADYLTALRDGWAQANEEAGL